MSVNVTGLNKTIGDIEKALGKKKMQHVMDDALKAGAKVFVAELKRQFETFRKTGASIKEITVSDPMWIEGSRSVRVHWKGPDDRYRIIHLNEWGTVNNPNPRGKGAIAKSMRNAEKAYIAAVRKAIERGL